MCAVSLCYVEFEDRMSVAKALALNGQLIGGYPIHIQQTSAAAVSLTNTASNSGGYRIYVGSLPYNITDGDIRPVRTRAAALTCHVSGVIVCYVWAMGHVSYRSPCVVCRV